MFIPPAPALNLVGLSSRPMPRLIREPAAAIEASAISEQNHLELIRSYASSGFTAVVMINSGALIAGLSQANNLETFPAPAIAFAVFVWALGVATGVATWGAAYRAVVALAAGDRPQRMHWRGVAAGLFHFSLCMFLLGFVAVGLALADLG